MKVADGDLTNCNYVVPYGTPPTKIRPEMTALYERAVESLNNARLTVYPAFVADARNYNVEVLAKDTLDGLDELARRTGGKMLGILDSLDFDSTIADLKKHFDSYYILSFILQSTRKD